MYITTVIRIIAQIGWRCEQLSGMCVSEMQLNWYVHMEAPVSS